MTKNLIVVTTIQHMHCMFKFNCTEKIISGLNRHLYKCHAVT